MIAEKINLSTCKTGYGEMAIRLHPAEGRVALRIGLHSYLPWLRAKAGRRPEVPRAGWALIAGSGDRCPLCRRGSEEGHGTFRTGVRRLPDGKIEKGSVTSRSRGNPEISPSWQGGLSESPASFRLYPGLASSAGAAQTKNQSKNIICHSERSEESLFLSRRDSSLRCAPFRMT
jgi:hypothetical protein